MTTTTTDPMARECEDCHAAPGEPCTPFCTGHPSAQDVADDTPAAADGTITSETFNTLAGLRRAIKNTRAAAIEQLGMTGPVRISSGAFTMWVQYEGKPWLKHTRAAYVDMEDTLRMVQRLPEDERPAYRLTIRPTRTR